MYDPPEFVRVIKSKKNKKRGNLLQVAEKKKYIQGFAGKKLKDGDHFQGLSLYRKIILKWMLKDGVRMTWTELIDFMIRTSKGLF